ncbi:MAG: WalW protein [Acidobacteria bacterium]|nr:WalW protein [Acidobacteriota bacterium]
MDLSPRQTRVLYPTGWKPVLVVVIDTEEEFDWSAPLNPQSTSVRAMASVLKAQRIFDEYGIRPTYVIDHPVASQPAGSAPLQEIAASGRCEIGAHLHPWVNPPVEEPVNLYNSYACNLPAPLAREKLRRLGAAISATFGFPPRSYKAGRYGISAAMIPALKEEGYEVDLSTAPPFDYRGDGGPDFTRSQPDCYWLGGKNEMLEIPTTGAFVGWGPMAPRLRFAQASTRLGEKLRIPGILSRLGVVDRLRLSPEGFTSEEHRKLTQFLVDRGVGVLTFSFHSPSLEPGHTAYVRSQADLEDFLGKFRRYFDYFFGQLGGRTMTALEVKRALAIGKES